MTHVKSHLKIDVFSNGNGENNKDTIEIYFAYAIVQSKYMYIENLNHIVKMHELIDSLIRTTIDMLNANPEECLEERFLTVRQRFFLIKECPNDHERSLPLTAFQLQKTLFTLLGELLAAHHPATTPHTSSSPGSTHHHPHQN